MNLNFESLVELIEEHNEQQMSALARSAFQVEIENGQLSLEQALINVTQAVKAHKQILLKHILGADEEAVKHAWRQVCRSVQRYGIAETRRLASEEKTRAQSAVMRMGKQALETDADKAFWKFREAWLQPINKPCHQIASPNLLALPESTADSVEECMERAREAVARF